MRIASKHLPENISRVVAAAESFHGSKLLGRPGFFPGRYTPFPSSELPRYTRYLNDSRSVNIEVPIDGKVHSYRLYGANIYEYVSMATIEKEVPGAPDLGAEAWKLFAQISKDPNLILRACTMSEVEKKHGFLAAMQAKSFAETGQILRGLPFPTHYVPIALDVPRYRESFFAEGTQAAGYSPESLEPIFAANQSRQPFQVAQVFEGISMRLRDLDNVTGEEHPKLKRKIEPFLLQAYGQTSLDKDALNNIIRTFCNSLIKAMIFVHGKGFCFWKNSPHNANMGLKDVSVTGTLFDPEPCQINMNDLAIDHFSLLFSIISFIGYFKYAFPSKRLVSIAQDIINSTGFGSTGFIPDKSFMPLVRLESLKGIELEPLK